VNAFSLYCYRFRFEALAPLRFPPGKAGNTFRGALGGVLPAAIFAPLLTAGPSGLADAPRPFVIRAAALDGRAFTAGETFCVDVHHFDLRSPGPECFVDAFSQLERTGLGAARAPVALRGVEMPEPSPVVLPLDPEPVRVERITVHFATPTELKTGGEVVAEPAFEVLFARIRDRVSTLRDLYGEGPLPIDFRGMAARAAGVRLVRHSLHRERIERRSSRTGQVHPLGGFTGEAEYEGDLAEFVPYLKAAYWTGVGRQTTWGKGVIELYSRLQSALDERRAG